MNFFISTPQQNDSTCSIPVRVRAVIANPEVSQRTVNCASHGLAHSVTQPKLHGKLPLRRGKFIIKFAFFCTPLNNFYSNEPDRILIFFCDRFIRLEVLSGTEREPSALFLTASHDVHLRHGPSVLPASICVTHPC